MVPVSEPLLEGVTRRATAEKIIKLFHRIQSRVNLIELFIRTDAIAMIPKPTIMEGILHSPASCVPHRIPILILNRPRHRLINKSIPSLFADYQRKRV